MAKKLTATDILHTADGAIDRFKRGNAHTLEKAIGCYVLGRKVGWRTLYLIHDKSSIRKYERILQVNFRDDLPEDGPLAKRSVAWRAAQGISNFWKAVKGEIPGIRSPDIDQG